MKRSSVLGGNGNGSSVTNAGSVGRYWSSTWSSSASVYLLYFDSSSVNPQYDGFKHLGRSVRCVKKSEWKGRVEKRVMKGIR